MPAAPEQESLKRTRTCETVNSIVVVGPSGAGKSTIVDRLVAEYPGCFGYCVSHTTRDARQGESDGVDYHFVREEEMRHEIEQGNFIEHAQVHGCLYGTSAKAVEDVVADGKICVLILDVQGAESVKAHTMDAHTAYVFVAPPSDEELESRLRKRGTETEEKVQKRLAAAKKEMQFMGREGFWDLVLVNESLEASYSVFSNFVEEACGSDRLQKKVARKDAKVAPEASASEETTNQSAKNIVGAGA